ncbi:MAG: type III-B CRISPR module RAMP protein Cmr6 [Anaerolineae bacterium]|nr:type III-B CRISPR module RAMP protein Cmr6 [Anaerolineae bacterium]
MTYPIPKASAEAWRAYQSQSPQNPGLVFERFAPDWSAQATRKKEGLEAVREAAEKADKALLKAWQDRWEATVKAAHAEPFSLKTDWRFIAGLGRKGALEVGFTFHRDGFPILPGSSVKGVARAWALIQIAEKLKTSALKNLDDALSADGDKDSKERKTYEDWKAEQSEEVQKLAEDFRAIFGTTAVAGQAVFFDAIPADLPKLELDIMNPHYPNYYSGSEYPTDWQSPVPIYFLTVAAKTAFRFAVGWRGDPDVEGQRLQTQAQGWLTGGLIHLGAGAKTAAGYGYFLPPESALSSQPSTTKRESAQAATPPAASVPTQEVPIPAAEPEPMIWRTGIVREYRPDKGTGRLTDAESGEELPFRREAIEEKGWSPGKKQKVRYAVAQREGRTIVVRVQRG